MLKTLKLLFVTFFVLAVIALCASAYVYVVTQDLPSIDKVVREGVNPSKRTQVFAADGTPILSHGKFRHRDVKLSEINPAFVEALIATEDRRFYSHKGVDPIAIMRAMVTNVKKGGIREGGSTLTQQLARNVFLNNERSINRKIREAALSLKLEKELSKDDILTLYVNNTYFGEGAYGIAAASEIYFGKKPMELSVDEAALLAGMPQAPSRYNPFINPDIAKKRRDEVIANLFEVGKIEEGEMKSLQLKKIKLNVVGRRLSRADKSPFFNRYVIQEIQKHFDLDEELFWQSGLKIYTTLDLRAQVLAENAVKEMSNAAGRTGDKQQAALVTINPHSGAVIAHVGGKDYAQSQFDRVTQATRSPGSLFKVFTYTTAIDKGYEPARVYLDEPIELEGWRPTNYDKSHHGYMTMAGALIRSNNVIAVKVLNEIGPDSVVKVAHNMGIESKLNPYLALTLGGSGVTPLEITSAIGTLANQGVRVEPYAIEKVYDSEGRLIYRHHPVRRDVLSRTTVDTMLKMMQGVVTHGTGRAAAIGRPVAGKTGTSDEYRDAWFVGFTPELVTGVWVGNDDNTPTGMTGGGLPARIWHKFMSAQLAQVKPSGFDVTYAKSVTEGDFIGYDIKNLSDGDVYNPLADNQVKDGILEDGSVPVPDLDDENASGNIGSDSGVYPDSNYPRPDYGGYSNGQPPLNPQPMQNRDFPRIGDQGQDRGSMAPPPVRNPPPRNPQGYPVIPVPPDTSNQRTEPINVIPLPEDGQ